MSIYQRPAREIDHSSFAAAAEVESRCLRRLRSAERPNDVCAGAIRGARRGKHDSPIVTGAAAGLEDADTPTPD